MNTTTLKARRILPVIVLSQFFCTTLWFAGNSVIEDMANELTLQPQFLAHITSVIQFGFIAGTLVYALLSLADRFSPSMAYLTACGDTHISLSYRFFSGRHLPGGYENRFRSFPEGAW
jgi:hypothetical protein